MSDKTKYSLSEAVREAKAAAEDLSACSARGDVARDAARSIESGLRAVLPTLEAAAADAPIDDACESCGGPASPISDKCGCGKVICATCSTVFGHFPDGAHGTGDPDDAVAALRARVAELEATQAVCHCGALVIDHNEGSGHSAVEMPEPWCPLEVECNEPKQPLRETQPCQHDWVFHRPDYVTPPDARLTREGMVMKCRTCGEYERTHIGTPAADGEQSCTT